ncbi:hypothetical protein [Actinomadura spongiicola]|uniref:hypothetical protein n=1 Tax=Actinomadura spongiicola TaxID=2303421 RepID=UPI0011C0E4D2|nr:hypothetical protein [Actinomadura spongiicola]
MPRNRYTRLIHQAESTQLAQQERELVRIARTLRRREDPVPVTAPDHEDKAHRRSRLARKQRDRPDASKRTT